MDNPQFFNTYRIVSSITFEEGKNDIFTWNYGSRFWSSAGNLSSHRKMLLLFHGCFVSQCCGAINANLLCSKRWHGEYKWIFYLKCALKLLLKYFYSKGARQDYTYRYLRVSCTYEVQKYVGGAVAMKSRAEWSPWFNGNTLSYTWKCIYKMLSIKSIWSQKIHHCIFINWLSDRISSKVHIQWTCLSV
jgi:hypothetical protein